MIGTVPRKIRTLLFSTLYPSSVRPGHGIFVETRLRHLLASGEVETRVVAPVPWFPFRHPAFGEYARHAAMPPREERNGIQIEHPQYLLLPKIGMNSAPYTLAHAGLAAAKKLIATGYDFDLIDAHYFYPDGVAATMIGKALNKPVVITARGSDINLLPRYRIPRRLILQAARDCAAVVTVSRALKEALVVLGAPGEKITVLHNGVDVQEFYEEDRVAARAAFRVSGFTLASVGNLIRSKGHHTVIEALTTIANAELLIAGRGPEEGNLKRLADRLGVADRVRFVGVLPQSELRKLYSAADCLVLASEREGCPNVLLEAMACGTPVVAGAVGGIPEVVASDEAGVLIGALNRENVVLGINRLRDSPPKRSKTRMYAEKFRWDQTSSGQTTLFCNVIAQRGSAHA